MGDSADVVTVTAEDAGDHVFEVSVDWVNISGFTVTGATTSYPSYYAAGIYLNGADYCNISENNASNNHHGIYLSSSSNNTLTDNTANSNNGVGICLSYSSNNTLIGNTANSNGNYGISMWISNIPKLR